MDNKKKSIIFFLILTIIVLILIAFFIIDSEERKAESLIKESLDLSRNGYCYESAEVLNHVAKINEPSITLHTIESIHNCFLRENEDGGETLREISGNISNNYLRLNIFWMEADHHHQNRQCRNAFESANFSVKYLGNISSQANRALGHAYFCLWEDEKAIKQYEKALEINPYNVDALNGAAIGYMRQGITNPPDIEYGMKIMEENKEIIEEYLLRAIEISPNYSKPYFNLGSMYVDLGYYEDAIYYKEKYLEIYDKIEGKIPANRDPEKNLIASYAHLGISHGKLNNLEISESYFEKIKKMIEKNSDLKLEGYVLLALGYKEIENNQKALKYFIKTEKILNENPFLIEGDSYGTVWYRKVFYSLFEEVKEKEEK